MDRYRFAMLGLGAAFGVAVGIGVMSFWPLTTFMVMIAVFCGLVMIVEGLAWRHE